MISLEIPSKQLLPGYAAALARGWAGTTVRIAETAEAELARIRDCPDAFIASLITPDAPKPPLLLPDGRRLPRLPAITRWIWDGEFCGRINFRWQKGTSSLPKHVLGHIGFAIVPWKRGRGYAAQALLRMLPIARAQGLDQVEITADRDNVASCRTIERAGGRLIELFVERRNGVDVKIVRYGIDLNEEVSAKSTGHEQAKRPRA